MCPWEKSLNGDSGPLCKHICDTIEVAEDIEVFGAMPSTDKGTTQLHILLKKNEKIFRYKIREQPAETGEPSLQASTALAQLIMNDPLLLKGVQDFECSPAKSFIVFHGHHVDISPYFDGTILQTSAIVTEIIRKVSTSSNMKHICNIGLVPITGNIAFLECEDTANGHRLYEEQNIRKWVCEQGTSPFTRGVVTPDDIRIVLASVPIHKQPTLHNKRKSVSTDNVPVKKGREISNKHLYCVWDRSGSMRLMGKAPFDGLKRVIQDQQAIAASSGNPTKITLYTFDNEMEIPLDNQDISTVDVDAVDEWIQPRATTRLYDTIVTAAAQMKERVQEGESGVLIVMTDGSDNASECDQTTVKKTLESLPDNIECIFMAANVGDAQAVGSEMGFRQETSMTFTSEASQSAFECMSHSALRSVTGGTAAFTQCERQSSVQTVRPTRVNPLRARTLF